MSNFKISASPKRLIPFQKRDTFRKVLTLLVIFTLVGSFAPVGYSAESGYGELLKKIYGATSVSYPHYTGSKVTANYSVSCTNYYLTNASCTYKYKIALVKLGGQWDVQVTSDETSGGGPAPGNTEPDKHENWYSHSQAFSVRAVNLEDEGRYRIDTYCRLKVTVSGIGSEEWLSDPSVKFTA